MQPFFCDEKDNFWIGQDAAQKLKSKSDKQFLRKRQGVLEVNKARWEEAQRYQRRTWLEGNGLRVTEDRNREHVIHFNRYAPIQGRYFNHAIELGCGPFTNMVHILKYVSAGQVTLLDPLVEDYLTHPHCRYKGRRLAGMRVTTVAETIENFRTDQKFDLIAMVNVLEQCFSAPRILEQIISLTAPKGILVFHDKLVPASSIEEFVRKVYSAGHPIRLADRIILEFLYQNYEELWTRHVPIPLEDYMGYTFDSIYFIGGRTDS